MSDVDPLVSEYTDGMLDLLNAGCGLFPGAVNDVVVAGEMGRPPAVPGSGELAAAAGAAAGGYERHGGVVAQSDEQLRRIAAEAAEAGRQGADAVVKVRETARMQVAALSPGATDSPASLRALVSSLDGHLEALESHINEAKTSNAALAARLRQLGDGYRQVGRPQA